MNYTTKTVKTINNFMLRTIRTSYRSYELNYKKKEVIQMKNYKNYNDQVNKNVTNLRFIDLDSSSIHEFYDKLFILNYKLTTDEKELELSIESGFELYSEELEYYKYEYINELKENIYVTYQVDLIGDYNQEHERLEIVYVSDIDSYVMPVYANGLS